MADEPVRLRWTPELVERFWDQQSRLSGHYFTEQHGAAIVARVARHLRGRRSVLDYGCGNGGLIEHLLGMVPAVAGLDFSPQSVRRVNTTFAGRAGFVGAFLPSELEAGQRFESVVCCEVIEHLYDEQLDGAIAHIRRLLAPQGVVVLTTPNREDLAANEVYCPVSNVIFHRWQHVRSWSPETLRTYLEDRGLCVVELFEADFGATWVTGKRRLLEMWARKLLGRRHELPHLGCVATAT